ncbi:MAG TPA: matrixin family metalloprotease, partial [Nakamurella sp.]
LGISADWVIVQASLFDATVPGTYDETVLVHELGHALNLPHRRDRRNLMYPESSPPDGLRGTALHPWQEAVLHANRHVVPGTARHR